MSLRVVDFSYALFSTLQTMTKFREDTNRIFKMIMTLLSNAVSHVCLHKLEKNLIEISCIQH